MYSGLDMAIFFIVFDGFEEERLSSHKTSTL